MQSSTNFRILINAVDGEALHTHEKLCVCELSDKAARSDIFHISPSKSSPPIPRCPWMVHTVIFFDDLESQSACEVFPREISLNLLTNCVYSHKKYSLKNYCETPHLTPTICTAVKLKEWMRQSQMWMWIDAQRSSLLCRFTDGEVKKVIQSALLIWGSIFLR